jgi:hypothetical protein
VNEQQTILVIRSMFSTTRFDLSPLSDLALATKDEEWFLELTDRMNFYKELAKC